MIKKEKLFLSIILLGVSLFGAWLITLVVEQMFQTHWITQLIFILLTILLYAWIGSALPKSLKKKLYFIE